MNPLNVTKVEDDLVSPTFLTGRRFRVCGQTVYRPHCHRRGRDDGSLECASEEDDQGHDLGTTVPQAFASLRAGDWTLPPLVSPVAP